MKRIISIVIVVMFVTSLSGCGAPSTAAPTVASNTTTSAKQTTELTIATTVTTTLETTAAKALTAEQVVAKLQEASLPITNVVVYDEKTDPNGKLGRPSEYTSKANFSDPAHEDDDKANPDNTVEVFATEADAKTRADYVESVSKGTAWAQYIYQIGVYVLRIDYDILPSDAQKYEDAFKFAIG
jgi:hypothetical protein